MCPAGSLSDVTSQEAVFIDGTEGAGGDVNAAAHGSIADLAPLWRRRKELGDGFAVAGDDDRLAGFYEADQFRQAVFGFSHADVHAQL